MKKLLIATGIFAPDIGGPATFATDIAHYAATNGHMVTILTHSPVRRFADDGRMPYRVVRVWRRLPFVIRHIWYAVQALRLARTHDVVLALNATSSGKPALRAARFWKKRFIVRVPGDAAWEAAVNRGATALLIDDFQKQERPARARRLHRMQAAVCMGADAVVAQSRYMAELIHGWGVPNERIHVIPNGVTPLIFPGSREEARRHTGVAGFALLAVGRLVPWKGFRMLIKLMPRLLQLNQSFRLYVIGAGPQMPELEAMVRNLRLERSVVLAGAKSPRELAAYYAAADVFVLNTAYEGFSHQLVEAMAAGVPVVTTSAGGNPEIVRQGENGIMVRFNDEFALQEAIRALWQQEELRSVLVEEGRKTAAVFTVKGMVEQYERILAA